MLASYADPAAGTTVAEHLDRAELNPAQRRHVLDALNAALTDTFYTILLALDGAASLGGDQRSYRIEDESGSLVSAGDGKLEAAAFEVFQAN